MKALRITLKRLREVLGLLKMLDAEFRKIKRQKFVLFTILAACLFPIPLTVLMVHAKLSYNVLFMFVLEFGFFLVLPIVLGIIAAILFHMENENGTLKNLSIIPVPRWKLLCAKVLVIYILAVFYGIAAIGATVVGGLLAGTVSGIPIKLAISFGMSVLTATASLPMIAVAVAYQKNLILPILCSVIYAVTSFAFSVMMLKIPAPLVLLFRCSLPFLTAHPERMEIAGSVGNWVLPVFPSILALIGIGIVCIVLSAYIYQKREV